MPKHKDFVVDPENWRDVFREATWDEALDLAASSLRTIRDTYGKRALAGFGSAKGRTKRRIYFRNWCAPGSDPTTWTTARASATPRAWPR